MNKFYRTYFICIVYDYSVSIDNPSSQLYNTWAFTYKHKRISFLPKRVHSDLHTQLYRKETLNCTKQGAIACRTRGSETTRIYVTIHIHVISIDHTRPTSREMRRYFLKSCASRLESVADSVLIATNTRVLSATWLSVIYCAFFVLLSCANRAPRMHIRCRCATTASESSTCP